MIYGAGSKMTFMELQQQMCFVVTAVHLAAKINPSCVVILLSTK
jgi:hypothetical protein